MNGKKLKRVAEWSVPDILFCVSQNDDATKAWIGSSDAGVHEFDLTAEKVLESRQAFSGDGHSSYVTGMARVGTTLCTCGYDRQLVWWDTQQRVQIRAIKTHEKWIRRLAIAPGGDRIYTVADDMRCRIWDFESGDLIGDVSDHPAQTPHHYPSMLYAIAVSADGSQFATGDRVGHVAIWDSQTFQQVGELETPVMYTWDPKQRRHSIGGIRSLAFSGDGTRLAVGGIGKIGNIDHLGGPARLEVFDLSSGDRLLEIEDNKKKGLIEQIVWADDDRWLLTAGGDNNGFLTAYDATSGEQVDQADQGGHVHAVSFDSEWQDLLAAGHRKLSRWTLADPVANDAKESA